MRYNPSQIEKKWQKRWLKEKIYEPDLRRARRPFYNLTMFPYPSAEGLHVGNMYDMVGCDIYGRLKRMQGFDVFQPTGLDGFGIHSENYALKINKHPRELSQITEKRFYEQIQKVGAGFAWREKLETYDPEYYKWTQWIFVQMFKNGLAYRKKASVNWCPSCLTVLADEQVLAGECERCSAKVVKKELEQWFFKITDYAERLLQNLDQIDWSERIKIAQRNWIGRSVGSVISFEIRRSAQNYADETRKVAEKIQRDFASSRRESATLTMVNVFTTRPDTLLGATYLVLSPEHPLLTNNQLPIANHQEVEEYIQQAKNKSEDERIAEGKEKTGVELKGIKAINPANQEEIPVWMADYVLGGVGTGAIMAVPAHDERDLEFAKKYKLAVRQVIAPKVTDHEHMPRPDKPNTRRNIVHVLLKHPTEEKVIALRSKKLPWLTPITGGVEEGEDVISAASREIKEETGYQNFRFVKKLPFKVFAEFYAAHKDVNRLTLCDFLFFELLNEEKNEIAEEEKNLHDLEWLPLKEVNKFTPISELDFMIEFLEHGEYAYTGEGVLINSGRFDDRPSEKAKWEITKFVGGAKKIQYRLRDWLISRQRYWGPPIPMIYCGECAKARPKILLIHGIGGNSGENWFPWFKKEMESRGYEVFIPDLPRANRPKLDEWISALKTLKLNKKCPVYIVGHSLGAPAACQFIRKTGLGVEKLILVAPTGQSQGDENWKNLRKAGVDSEGIKIIREFNSQNIKLKEVKRFVKNSVVYLSDNDPFIPLSVKNDYQELNPEVKIFEKRGHFNGGAGIKELPEILEEFPVQDNLNSGWVPVPEKDLPVKLPDIKNFRPTGTDKSPLATVEKFYKVRCPNCKSWARRETDVSDTFLDSAWYYFRYIDIKNKKRIFDKALMKKWLPVDRYMGGFEHAVLHLLYTRFVTMAFHDWGLIDFDGPFKIFRAHGHITKDSAKMSKSRGNVVNPDEYIKAYGADALRMYLMFIGPFEQGGDFSDTGIRGITRFLERVWRFGSAKPKAQSAKHANNDLRRLIHKTIKKVTEDIEGLQYNTAISALMILLNAFEDNEQDVSKENLMVFLRLLAPFAPHISEELYQELEDSKKFRSIHRELWPKYDPSLIVEEKFELIIQVNGKLRGRVTLPMGIKEEEARKAALALPAIKQYVSAEPQKTIFVPNKLVNFVV